METIGLTLDLSQPYRLMTCKQIMLIYYIILCVNLALLSLIEVVLHIAIL